MKIFEMDWVGSITFAYLIIGVVYILLMVNYFIRFIWAKSYIKYMADEVINIYENHISPIFSYNKAIYLDNGSHFIN